MLGFQDTRRRRPRGATLLGAFLLVTIVLAGWLGYEAIDAARSHRLAVEAALRDYAEISVHSFSRVVEDRLDDALDYHFFGWVQRRTGRRTLASPDALRPGIANYIEDHPCDCPHLEAPLAIFRYAQTDDEVIVSPDTVSEDAVRGLSQRVFAEWYRPQRSGEGVRTIPAGQLFDSTAVMAYWVVYDTVRAPRAVYGIVFDPRAVGEMIAPDYPDANLLPEPIAKDQPNDSLVHATVHGPDGTLLYESAVTYPAELRAEAELPQYLGGLQVATTVRPDEASQLIIGGLPRSRLPLIMLLLVLTMGVGLATFVQLRKERDFQRLRDDFVSGVSHELRTPLAQIRMFAELQESGQMSSPEDRSRAVSVIHREARRLSHLVENLLRFSRLQRTSLRTLPREELELGGLIEEGIDAVAPLLEAEGMTLDFVHDDPIPVMAHRGAITRIVVNLLDNAVKYGPSRQTITVRVEEIDGEARVSISDMGPGIPASERERIWRPYRRLERDVRGTKPGTGIGLAVVAELVAQQDGRAWVEEAEGGGARFVVALPLVDAEAAGAAASTAPSGTASAGGDGRTDSAESVPTAASA